MPPLPGMGGRPPGPWPPTSAMCGPGGPYPPNSPGYGPPHGPGTPIMPSPGGPMGPDGPDPLYMMKNVPNMPMVSNYLGGVLS